VDRTCGGTNEFNSGTSRCPVTRGKLKGGFLVEKGTLLPETMTAEAIEKAAHADRPDRIYPFRLVEEFAPSGGEAQTAQQGYGASKVTDYSAFIATVTLDKYDAGLKANVVDAKNSSFELYWVNDANTIFGVKGNDGKQHGIPLSGIYVGGQDFDSSGQVANMTISFMYQDIEAYWKKEMVQVVDFDIVDSLNGLVNVEFVAIDGAANKYKLLETSQRLNLTQYYGAIIASKSSTVLEGATTASYADGVLTITGTDYVPKLAKPSVLQESGIIGIEQAA